MKEELRSATDHRPMEHPSEAAARVELTVALATAKREGHSPPQIHPITRTQTGRLNLRRVKIPPADVQLHVNTGGHSSSWRAGIRPSTEDEVRRAERNHCVVGFWTSPPGADSEILVPPHFDPQTEKLLEYRQNWAFASHLIVRQLSTGKQAIVWLGPDEGPCAWGCYATWCAIDAPSFSSEELLSIVQNFLTIVSGVNDD